MSPVPSAVRKAMRMDQYAYVIDFLPLAGGASAEGNFIVENEADFDLEQLTYFAEIGGTTQTESSRVIPVVTVTLSTVDTRKLNFKALPIPALFGTGSIPFVFKRAKRLVARSQLIANVSNRVPATAYNLWLVFIGTKLYRS